VIGILKKASLVAVAGSAILLGGCATRESVEHAQMTADQALSAAQHAQGTADQALSAAQTAQQGVDQLRTEEQTRVTTHRGQRG